MKTVKYNKMVRKMTRCEICGQDMIRKGKAHIICAKEYKEEEKKAYGSKESQFFRALAKEIAK